MVSPCFADELQSILENKKRSNIIGALSAVFRHPHVDTPQQRARQHALRLSGWSSNWERHYLMIIEIILYNHTSLTAGHQSVDYSTPVHATTRADLRMCNFRLALFALPPPSPLIKAKTPAETSGFSCWKSHSNVCWSLSPSRPDLY